MLLMIQPKYSVSNTVGFLKEKSAIRIFRNYLRVKRTTRDDILGERIFD